MANFTIYENIEFNNIQHNGLFKAQLHNYLSQSSVLLQFLEKCEAAQMWLPLSVLPQYQQVVGWACDQTALPEAHKHLPK